jgi:L-threonylcarbamoyladenylate synthase
MDVIKVDLRGDYSEAIAHAVRVLSYGGTVVYPTDTVYGIGANALEEIAVKKVFNVKQRPFAKPLPMFVRNMRWAEELVYINPANKRILEKIWPGKVTAVLPKRDIIPDILTAGESTVGLRICSLKFINDLLKAFGYPLVSTSANISGEEATRDPEDIMAVFERAAVRPSLIIDAGVLPPSEPSTVLDLTGSEPKILRVGPSRPEELLKLLDMK